MIWHSNLIVFFYFYLQNPKIKPNDPVLMEHTGNLHQDSKRENQLFSDDDRYSDLKGKY